MRQSLIELIPGYAEAVQKETLVRDAAFFPITESVGGFECRQMSLRDYLVLKTARNPLLYGLPPTPEQLAAFFWLLSPDYRPGKCRARRKLLRRCRSLFMPPPYRALINTRRARLRHQLKCEQRQAQAQAIVQAALAYVAETLQDRPPQQRALGFEPDYYSEAADICAAFGREFHQRFEDTLNMPLKQIFQFLAERRLHNGSQVPASNPSDKVKAEWLRAVNRRN